MKKNQSLLLLNVFFALIACSEGSGDRVPDSGPVEIDDASDVRPIQPGDADADSDSGPSKDASSTDTGPKDAGFRDTGLTVDANVVCQPGAIGCTCVPNNGCDKPASCIAALCRLIAVWGPYEVTEPEKHLLWWSDQGVWQ